MGRIGDLRIEILGLSRYVENNICGIRSQLNALSQNIEAILNDIANNKIKLSELPNNTSFNKPDDAIKYLNALGYSKVTDIIYLSIDKTKRADITKELNDEYKITFSHV